MNRDWEKVFSSWANGPSESEQERAENAEKQIREAIRSSNKLKNRNISVFTQGSYRNRVNVKKDSDVDIGIVCFDVFFPEYPDDNVKAILNESLKDSHYDYATFKNEIEEALVNRFGFQNVKRGNKSFDIKENTYRVEADVAAFFEHRRYISLNNYLSGVEMIPDNYMPRRIRNWPEQHYSNGVEKNNETSRKFKRIVRILKTLSNEMARKDINSASSIPSFLIECLVWNTPNEKFNQNNYIPLIREILIYIFNNTIESKTCEDWGEVSELKYLFRSSQPWTKETANRFVYDAWNYIGFQ